jgi:hypothetical protein
MGLSYQEFWTLNFYLWSIWDLDFEFNLELGHVLIVEACTHSVGTYTPLPIGGLYVCTDTEGL